MRSASQRVVLQQLGAAGGDHHRVEHDVRGPMLLERVGHGIDHLGVGEHAELHRADVEVVEAGVDLRAQEADAAARARR